MQDLQRLDQPLQGIHASDSAALEQCIHQLIRAGQRCRMGNHDLPGSLGSTRLDRHHGLAHLSGNSHRSFERSGVGDRLQVETDGRDPFLLGEGADGIVQVELELVTQRDYVGNRQTPPLHRQIEGHIGGHGDQRYALFDAPATLLIGPQHGSIDIVEHAVAVGTDQRHVAARLEELPLELSPLLARLGKPRRVADGTTRISSSQPADDVDGQVAIHRHIGGIRTTRKLVDRTVDLTTQNLVLLGVDRPEISLIAHQIALTNQLSSRSATKNSDGTRLQ